MTNAITAQDNKSDLKIASQIIKFISRHSSDNYICIYSGLRWSKYEWVYTYHSNYLFNRNACSTVQHDINRRTAHVTEKSN